MDIFRFIAEDFNTDFEDTMQTTKGFVYAEGWDDAFKKVKSIFTDPSGKCSLESISILLTESFDNGVISDDMIKETWENEKTKTYIIGE